MKRDITTILMAALIAVLFVGLAHAGITLRITYEGKSTEQAILSVGENSYLPITTVEIEIKPCSCPNAINPNNRGVVPVAILTTSITAGESVDFDATTVDPLSVQFGPDGATEKHGRGHIEDVDGDGDLDMVLHFRTQETGITDGDTIACITGETTEGQSIEGCDAIVTVPHERMQVLGTFRVPTLIGLAGNCPSQFDVGTDIYYSLSRDADVLLQVYDAAGRLVKTIIDQNETAGDHSVSWDGKDATGMKVPSATYFCRFTADEMTSVKKMILLR